MSTMDELRREKHMFHQSYSNLCSLKSLDRLSIRCKNLAHLDFFVDHISLDEWSPILMSLSRDLSLSSVSLRCRFQCADILEDVDDEAKCLAVNRRPLIFTRYLLLYVIDALCGCMRGTDTLTCLQMDGILLDVEYLDSLCRGIEACRTLEKLSLRNCEVRDEGAAVLCATLQDLSHVTRLDLSQCGLTSKGVKTVARLVAHQKELRSRRGWTSEGGYGKEYFLGLRRITLNQNVFVGDVGCRSLLDALKDDNGIKALDLQNCGLSDASAVRALEILDKNSSVSVLDMRSNPISLCLLKQINLAIRALTTPDCDWLPVEKCLRPKQASPLLAHPTKTKTGPRSACGDSVRSGASFRGSSVVSCGPDTSNMNPGPRSACGDSVRSGASLRGSSIVSCGPDTSNMNPGPRSACGDSVRSGVSLRGSSLVSCGPDQSNASTLQGISEIASCYSHAEHAQCDYDADSLCCESLADTDVSLLVSEDEIRTRNDEVQVEMEKVRQARRKTEILNDASTASVLELTCRVERERQLRLALEQEMDVLQQRIDRLLDTMTPQERQNIIGDTNCKPNAGEEKTCIQ